ncbi:DUF2235 domain-containing protein [Rodentibacter pneumotropicus]|uniref:DUF2235 domain-containing protein n=1 Tax=Rodentibacter pneumotropicus TaxID=758 RepID=UPI001EE1DA9B|nr:DUF2235 domain-containing protein [Rodentibacter pneumotropicus]
MLKGQKLTECEIVVKAIYIEGVGTISGKEDYSTGGAFGTLGGQRIRRAIAQIKTILAKYPAREYQQQIDVFGFSRGAAMARDFINSLANEGVKLKHTIKFVGIFDTVGSFGYPGNDQNWKPKLGWTKELQNYCTIATRNITELHDFLNEGEKRTNGGQGALRADRNIPHLKILAKYAHHSAGIFKDEVYLPAPLGFKHRLYNNTVEDIAKSPINRDKRTKIPKRNIFDNNPRLAVIKKD